MKTVTEQNWPVLLFNKSALKQRKYKEITVLLGNVDQLNCLDIGSDNGVISYLLRKGNGNWKSADLEMQTVEAIRDLVHDDVFQIDGGQTPFQDNEFDKVVIVDFLEHIRDDAGFIEELYRIIKPGGELIINVPYVKNSLLRKLRLAIGQTDEKHGHLRHGYTSASLRPLLDGKFNVGYQRTYSKFFSEAVDTLVTFGFGLLKKDKAKSQKGLIIVSKDLEQYKKLFKAYSMLYPILWFFVQLDKLLFWRSGYMLIVKAKSTKLETLAKDSSAELVEVGSSR